MSDEYFEQRFPKLRKLSIALLEHLVTPAIGENAVKEIKVPLVEKELRDSLGSALESTEKRFIAEHTDQEACEAILSLPLANLPTVLRAVRQFYSRPTDPALGEILRGQLSAHFTHLSAKQVEASVSKYLRILRDELASLSTEIREKLSTNATLGIQDNTKQIAETLDRIEKHLTHSTFGTNDKPDDIGRNVKVGDAQRTGAPDIPFVFAPGCAPPVPSLMVGREDDLKILKERLSIGGKEESIQVLTAIKGWPGVGKTTLASAVAHDADIITSFPDGVLWVSLGQRPNLSAEIAIWGRALGMTDLMHSLTVDQAKAQLVALLRNRRMLLIIDDVWEAENAVPFLVGGKNCATLVTTRLGIVASTLAPIADNIYRLDVLSDTNAVSLLQRLAPEVYAQNPKETLALARELEGLPLALQVAGRLLSVEAQYGFGVADLLFELSESTRLLKAQAPAGYVDLSTETTPTVATLLLKSLERLDDFTRKRYAYLGVFAPKPATFDLAAMEFIWQIEDPTALVKTLVDRGLLEYVPEMGRYQMHALLVMLAKSLLTAE